MNLIEKFEGVITALEPISHVEKTIGIVTKFRRLKIFVDGQVELIPVISGNSLRGILHRCGARHLLSQLGLAEKDLPIKVNHVLFRGGMVERGVAATYDVNFECTLRSRIPLLSLFGTAVRQQLIHGKLNVGMLFPIARETRFLTGIESNISVWDLCQQLQYTRRDDREQRDPEPVGEGRQQAEQMLYRTEVLIPGTQFKHNFTLKDATAVERACFMRCLREFELSGMILGGDNRIGHGRVSWTYVVGDTKAYDDFLRENKDVIRKFLLEEMIQA